MTIEQLYLNHKSLSEIEQITGIRKKRLEYLIYHKMGLKREPKKHPKTDRVLHLKTWGYNPEEIAEGEGIKLKTVRKILENAQT